MTGIAQRLDRALTDFPTIGLVDAPTPLEPLDRLSATIGGPRIWVKREDLTGLGFGGNKLRKLDVVLAEARKAGADCLVSCGVVQSNSQRQVAAAAVKLGLGCHLAVYHGRVAPPGPAYESSGNALLNRLYGAQLHDVPWNGDRSAALGELMQELTRRGHSPYLVPYGVSSPLGAMGYVRVARELAQQIAASGLSVDAIVFCTGSGATQAGLALGASALLPETEVVGIDIDAEPERVRADVIRWAEGAAELLNLPFTPESIEVVAGLAGPAYGVPHQATIDALKLVARTEALLLDPVYSAKGLAGLISLIRDGRWGKGSNVIFLHTGGAPALFAYQDSLQLEDQPSAGAG